MPKITKTTGNKVNLTQTKTDIKSRALGKEIGTAPVLLGGRSVIKKSYQSDDVKVSAQLASKFGIKVGTDYSKAMLTDFIAQNKGMDINDVHFNFAEALTKERFHVKTFEQVNMKHFSTRDALIAKMATQVDSLKQLDRVIDIYTELMISQAPDVSFGFDISEEQVIGTIIESLNLDSGKTNPEILKSFNDGFSMLLKTPEAQTYKALIVHLERKGFRVNYHFETSEISKIVLNTTNLKDAKKLAGKFLSAKRRTPNNKFILTVLIKNPKTSSKDIAKLYDNFHSSMKMLGNKFPDHIFTKDQKHKLLDFLMDLKTSRMKKIAPQLKDSALFKTLNKKPEVEVQVKKQKDKVKVDTKKTETKVDNPKDKEQAENLKEPEVKKQKVKSEPKVKTEVPVAPSAPTAPEVPVAAPTNSAPKAKAALLASIEKGKKLKKVVMETAEKLKETVVEGAKKAEKLNPVAQAMAARRAKMKVDEDLDKVDEDVDDIFVVDEGLDIFVVDKDKPVVEVPASKIPETKTEKPQTLSAAQQQKAKGLFAAIKSAKKITLNKVEEIIKPKVTKTESAPAMLNQAMLDRLTKFEDNDDTVDTNNNDEWED